MKRALYVIHYPVFGGPHNQALRLAKPMARRGWETVVMVPDEPGNAAARLSSGDISVIQAPMHRLRATADPRTQLRFSASFGPEVQHIRRLIRSENIDLVVIGGLVNPHGAIAARLEGVPVVWQLLDTRSPMTLRRMLMPVVSRLADSVMSTGSGVARVHPGATSLGRRLVPFFPPVDTASFRPDPARRAAARAELRVPDGACVIGTVGNLNAQKGHEYLIRAAASIRQAHPNIAVRILGASTPTQAGYERSLRDEAQSLGFDGRGDITFVDPGPRVADLLPAFDVFLLTSVPRSEGIPTVVLEAMACGIPVVATDVGAVGEVVEDGVTGFVVPPLDPLAIAGATLRLLDDGGLRGRMSDEARRRAVERYDVEVSADTHVRAFEVAEAHQRSRQRLQVRPPIQPAAADDLRKLLVCPACQGALAWSPEVARCTACCREYPVIDGIPLLLLDQSAAEHDEIDHIHGHHHKQQQAAYFDREDAAEFETVRPHGADRFYRWLLLEKFRRSMRGLRPVSVGDTALTVCGGSGMDAEFLARIGMRVIVSDISIGAAQRARERSRRFGLGLLPIVADVERLPFADRSIGAVYVHDGLHHLERPVAGLAEMGRVAKNALSVTEPARSGATALAVRLGLALEREEAGNRVARLTLREVEDALGAAGFDVTHAERYAMYYRHQPGTFSAALSGRLTLPVVRWGWRAANGLAGRWGNKLTVQAVRR